MNDSAFSMNYATSLSGGREVVVTAGVPVQLSSTSIPCSGVIIQSLRSNSGNISVGGSDVSGALGSENGVELVIGQTVTLPVNDLSRIWIDADSSGDGAQFLILK